MTRSSGRIYRFGDFDLEADEHRLLRSGTEVPLRPKPFQTLLYLVERHGHLIEKAELLEKLWKDAIVSEGALTRCIKEVRQALGDDAHEPRYLETKARVGFTFIAEVEEISAAAPSATTRRRLWMAVAALVLLAVGAITTRWIRPEQPAAAAAEIRSLAVLPFENLTNEPGQEYFVEGMQETLIGKLSKISALKVISRTSAMRYRHTDKSIPQIARELGVDALVEGSVMQEHNRVRIAAQLIHGTTDEHLWAASYDRNREDVLGLLSEVATSIADEIEVTVTPEQMARLAEPETLDPQAQELFLKANFFFNRLTPRDLQKAIDLYSQTLQIDPGFAPAYERLAIAHLVTSALGWVPPEEAKTRIEAAAHKALELDPRLARAYTALGWVKLHFDWDWLGAEADLRRALELDPNDPVTHHGLADLLLVQGDLEGSVRQVMLGRTHDPLSPMILAPVVGHLVLARRYEEAITEGEQAIELFPDLRVLRFFVGTAHWYLGDYETALEHYRARAGAAGPRRDWVEALQTGLPAGGPQTAMRALGDYLAEFEDPRPFRVAAAYAGAGENDLAFEWLDKTLEKHDYKLLHLVAHPDLDPIRSDPRFQDLLTRIGIPLAAGG